MLLRYHTHTHTHTHTLACEHEVVCVLYVCAEVCISARLIVVVLSAFLFFFPPLIPPSAHSSPALRHCVFISNV